MNQIKKAIYQFILIFFCSYIITVAICFPFAGKDYHITLEMLLFPNLFFFSYFIRDVGIKFETIHKRNIDKFEYYREPINNLSPMMCAKLMGKNIANKDVVTAMILYLKDIDYQSKEIRNHEKFFIKNKNAIFYDLYNHKKTKINGKVPVLNELNSIVYRDLVKENYFEEAYSRVGDMIFFLYAMFMIFFSMDLGNGFDSLEANRAFDITFWTTTLLWASMYVMDIHLKLTLNSFKTQKGWEYTNKLKAQKNFLNQFTIINKRSIQETSTFGYYIRMAILFNLKGKLDQEAYMFYKNTIKEFDYNDDYKDKQEESIILSVIITIIVLFPYIASLFSTGTVKFILGNIPLILFYNGFLTIIQKQIGSTIYTKSKKNDD